MADGLEAGDLGCRSSDTRRLSLKPVTIGGYEAGSVLIKAGLEPGERVVVDGGKLLSSGQLVTYDEERS